MLKPKLNYFSPLPPLKSGISDYSEELLKELKKHFEITSFIDDKYLPNDLEGIKIKNYKECNNNYPTIHNIGNSAFHIYSYKKLEKDLHKFFSSKRIKGEWFEISEKDIENILSSIKIYCKIKYF